ncbi:YlcI/YnfO family protein [Nitrosomonas sp. Nm166]|uniref:YlcI/YnfO family protein n=1 Tax=Nitrosomonas sp. Nm166 TaxID=1881054 RepID=UPI0008F11609|nr:ribbon-helix-helix domain-containing protein [Nitrosomonas sp. Nm166]SFD84156.1 Ribbon-helix-helix protein, copG family [Nitrosomonas sp. Nm166]
MSQIISARLPDELVAALDEAAAKLHRTRADVIRQAVEYYLDDFEDISFPVLWKSCMIQRIQFWSGKL